MVRGGLRRLHRRWARRGGLAPRLVGAVRHRRAGASPGEEGGHPGRGRRQPDGGGLARARGPRRPPGGRGRWDGRGGGRRRRAGEGPFPEPARGRHPRLPPSGRQADRCPGAGRQRPAGQAAAAPDRGAGRGPRAHPHLDPRDGPHRRHRRGAGGRGPRRRHPGARGRGGPRGRAVVPPRGPGWRWPSASRRSSAPSSAPTWARGRSAWPPSRPWGAAVPRRTGTPRTTPGEERPASRTLLAHVACPGPARLSTAGGRSVARSARRAGSLPS
jgi:hypothetical protein